ncbi:hypothetical protein [Limosilactobacillus mucosae]|uniref:hypothetical protein n=1 Tax=Limosilactobacillus mucosae TaxID=97478 RepID=UPI001F59798B|nr:hypothetical protein [Limosilactobacillus mucosae]UNL61577.1 hypothetical protein G8B17_04345 [Limosilactobacillus mucosae]
MAVTNITAGQEDWLSTLNNDLTELSNRDSGTWTSTGLTAMNGYTLNGCNYFYGVIGGRKYLLINGNVSISSGSIDGQANREVIQLPGTVKGCGMKVTDFAYVQNSNNGYPLRVDYNATTKRLSFTNITGASMTFTSIDFGIIMTE